MSLLLPALSRKGGLLKAAMSNLLYVPILQAQGRRQTPAGDALGGDCYLKPLSIIKRRVRVLVIGLLNGTAAEGWLNYAQRIEPRRRRALELNVYHLATDLLEDASSVERRVVDTVTVLKELVAIPIAVKLSPFYSSLLHLTAPIERIGAARGTDPLQRFRQPDLDPDTGRTPRDAPDSMTPARRGGIGNTSVNQRSCRCPTSRRLGLHQSTSRCGPCGPWRRCEHPTCVASGLRSSANLTMPARYDRRVGGLGRIQHIRLVAQLAAQPRVALAPGLEAPRDRVEQPGFRQGLFLNGRPAEKTRAQLGVPADVVAPAHLIFEEPRQQQALRARRFHHQAAAQQGRVGYEMVEDHAEIRGSRPIDVGLCGYLSVVRQHAGVVEQFLSIDGGLGYVLKALDEELQRLPMIGREQFPQRIQ